MKLSGIAIVNVVQSFMPAVNSIVFAHLVGKKIKSLMA